MAFDKYVKLPGSERKPMPGAAKSGTLDPNEPMHVTLVLRERTPHGKEPSLAELVASGKRVSREEYAERYGADPKDVKEVENFAHAHGLKVGQVNLPARTVALTGNCDAFTKAFQVELAAYQYQGKTYRGRTGAVSIPSELNGVVVGVHGLDNRPQAQTHFRTATNASRGGRNFIHSLAGRPGL